MKKILLTLILFLSPALHAADDMQLYVPHPPRAPSEAPKNGGPVSSIGPADADELRGEFGGILYMALKPYAYEKWPGKEMSDCNRLGNGYHCEMITGHANAHYYFFREPGSGNVTLQQLDTHFEVADPAVLKTLRRTGQRLFGAPPVHGEKASSNEPGWDGMGAGWKWQTDQDIAFLYMDSEQASSTGEGVARFQWRRSPLYSPRTDTRSSR
jgi:hypothetical protein